MNLGNAMPEQMYEAEYVLPTSRQYGVKGVK